MKIIGQGLDNLTVIKNECKKIIDFMKDNYNDFPHGACGITSRLLVFVLQKIYKLETAHCISGRLKMQREQHHKFVWVNGYIIDLTISQFNKTYGFNFPEIYIADSFNEFNNLFDYESISICSYDMDLDLIEEYCKMHNYSIKEIEIIPNINGQDFGQ